MLLLLSALLLAVSAVAQDAASQDTGVICSASLSKYLLVLMLLGYI